MYKKFNVNGFIEKKKKLELLNINLRYNIACILLALRVNFLCCVFILKKNFSTEEIFGDIYLFI